MKLRILVSFILAVGTVSTFAGAKEDFVQAVKSGSGSCDAVKPTGGRQGTVMKWKTCTSDTVVIDGCTLACKGGAKIGG
jgi:hypothetical protein